MVVVLDEGDEETKHVLSIVEWANSKSPANGREKERVPGVNFHLLNS